MAHEIEKNDNVVLHSVGAWHGLGIVVEDAPTPREALKIAGLDYEIEQWPLSATNGESRLTLSTHVLNIRTDKKIPLGVVSSGYKPIQNHELAEFCEALAEGGDQVKIESAGSIRNGQKLWFLLKGESFSVRKEDEVKPYILVSNGHDGATALRCTPTTIRVVCSNTLHMVIPQSERTGRGAGAEKLGIATFVAHHTQSIHERVEQAKRALQLYGKSIKKTREVIDALAAKDLDNAQVKRFFLECYARDFGPVPAVCETLQEEKKRTKAIEACRAMARRFESEKQLAGTTAWGALNAYTGWVQHDRLAGRKVANLAAAKERRAESRLTGVDGDRSSLAMIAALSLVS